MARFETVHIFIFIVFFILNVVYLVECEDKRWVALIFAPIGKMFVTPLAGIQQTKPLELGTIGENNSSKDPDRIIIYVPRRIKTVHHHHHHVVLMDPKSKTVTHARPYAEKSSSSSASSAEDFQQRELARDHQHQYARQQHHQVHHQSVVGFPVSYTEQRKTVRAGTSPQPPPQSQPSSTGGGDPDNVNLMVYQAAPLPLVHVPVAYAAWPARKKRSKVIARLFTY